MTAVIFSLESVLTAGANPSITQGESVAAGRLLYDSLKSQYRVVILSEYPDVEAVRGWLIRERVTQFAFVHTYDRGSGLSPEAWKVAKVKELQAQGHHIGFYVDGNPNTVAEVMELGINGVLVAYSAKVPGAYGRDRAITPWYDLVSTIEEHAMIRATVDAEDDDEDR